MLGGNVSGDDTMDLRLPSGPMMAIYREGILQQLTDSLSALLDQLPSDRGTILDDLSSMADGCRPLMLSQQVWLSTSLTAGDMTIVTVVNASRLELDEWLEDFHGNRPGILTDGSGNILAMTEAAGRLFSSHGGRALGDALDRVSFAAFTTAAGKCLRGESVKDFTALTEPGHQGRRSLLVSLQRLGERGTLIVAAFSSPSLAMTAFEADDSRLVRTIFSTIPIPAARIDGTGTVVAVNSHAARLAANTGFKEPISTSFLDWVSKDDRSHVEALHRNRMDGRYAPFRFRTNLVSGSEEVGMMYEITSILMPDGSSTLVFFVPVERTTGDDAVSLQAQTVRELTEIISEDSSEGDYTKTLLEFARVGTGAGGAVFRSRDRRVTVGDAPLSSERSAGMEMAVKGWSEDSQGISLTIPVGHREGEGTIRLVGLPSKNLDPTGWLVARLSPMLAHYAGILQTTRSSSFMFSSITDFVSLLRGRDRDVRLVLERLGDITGADRVAIHTISPREPILQPLMTWGTAALPGGLPLEIPSIASWVYTHSETCYVPDTSIDQRFSPVFSSSLSELAVPLMIEGKGRGTLVVGSDSCDSFLNPIPRLLETLGMILSFWLFGEDTRSEGDQVSQDSGRNHHIGLEDLLRSLSHRMRAPISTLRAHTDLLISGRLGELDSEQLDSLKSMNMALVDLVEYAERMLTFMKIELQGDTLENAWARPSDVVSSLLPILSEKGGHSGISVTAQLPSEPFTANFDRSVLEQIIGNLVNNAIQFSRAKGSVTISVRQDDEEHWSIEVFNTGEGIPPEDLPHVFDRFFTGGNTDSSVRGLGIGLAIVKSFVEQMGGTVSTRSRSGYGTWFTVRLPLS